MGRLTSKDEQGQWLPQLDLAGAWGSDREMASCQRKAAGWAREIDPNHLILSAEWLFGTGTMDVASAGQFNYLDELDVEPALSWLPNGDAIRQSAIQNSARIPCVVAGLEC